MKRILAMGIAMLLMLALAGCGEYADEVTQASEASSVTSEPNDFDEAISRLSEPVSVEEALLETLTGPHSISYSLSFASLQELMRACKTARDGGDLTKYVPEWVENPAVYAETINLAALDKIFLPTNIPEPYRFRGISVYGDGVSIRYLREEHSGTEPEAYLERYSFRFTRRATEEELNDGKELLCGTNRLEWTFDGREMSLYLPTSIDVYTKEISLIEYLGLDSVEDLAQFTEVEVIELG